MKRSVAWLTLVGAISVASFFVAGSVTHASDGYPVRGKAFSIAIETNKFVYEQGDPIEIRLTVKNTSSQELHFDRQPPSFLTELVVTDEEGRRLPSNGRRGARLQMVGYALAPGASLSPEYFPPDGSPPSPWQNIEDWGYQLTHTGKYRIVAFSQIHGYSINGHALSWFSDIPTNRSNAVTITVK